MKKVLILCGALALAGCATVTAENITERAKQIQSLTALTCKFVPTVQTIIGIINKGAGDATGIAVDICAALTTMPLAEGPGKRRAYVRGVEIRGKRIR